MRILVTGAAGRIGRAAVEHLAGAGHAVTATDAVFRAGLAAPLRVLDLTDGQAVHRLLADEGPEAVLHLGNHPNALNGLARQRILAENVAMTANVLYAATDLGLGRIVYASSIQAMMDMPAWMNWEQPPPPCPFPRLPVDGSVPVRTGTNPYAISKAHGEELLRAFCRADPGLVGVALRLPFVYGSHRGRWNRPWPFRPEEGPREAMAALHVADACRLFEAALTRSPAGYRCHFPASCRAVAGIGPADLARKFLAHVPVEGDLRGPGGLVALGTLEAELGWTPREPTPLLWPDPGPDAG